MPPRRLPDEMERYPERLRQRFPFVSRETEVRLERYVDGLVSWSTRLNLIAGSTTSDIWERHIADSLGVLAIAPQFESWTDFGSGAGLPGLVVAAHAQGFENASVAVVESNRKKTAFLSAMRPQVCPSVRVHPMRIEDHVATAVAPQIVSARAVAPLSALLAMIEPWSAAGTRALFPKGRGYANELRDSDADWTYDMVIHDSAVEPGSVILDLSGIKRKH